MDTTILDRSIAEYDLDTLTRTLWGEARGEIEEGQVAVAWVVRNRAEWPERSWWGATIGEVCRKPFQFSCWNETDPNRRRLARLSPADATYRKLRVLALRVVQGELADPTGGATHYRRIGWPASWAKGRKPIAVIGNHEFFRLGPGA